MVAIVALLAVGNGLNIGFAPPLFLGPTSKFTVSFYNDSARPIKVLRESCSWGYGSISFELTSPAGKTYSITRKSRPWFRNAPSTIDLAPRGLLTRDIDFGDGTWQGFPAGIVGQTTGWWARVGLTVKSDFLLGGRGIWTGQIWSPWRNATLN